MIRAQVIQTWQTLPHRQRKELRRLAMRAKDPGMRCRCKVVLALVQGKTPTMITQGGLCAKSQVYRVAEMASTVPAAVRNVRRERDMDVDASPILNSLSQTWDVFVKGGAPGT